jgi:hypothetical protein
MVEVRFTQPPKRSSAFSIGRGVDFGNVGGAGYLNISARDFSQGQVKPDDLLRSVDIMAYNVILRGYQRHKSNRKCKMTIFCPFIIP